jgi:hypothetical protein
VFAKFVCTSTEHNRRNYYFFPKKLLLQGTLHWVTGPPAASGCTSRLSDALATRQAVGRAGLTMLKLTNNIFYQFFKNIDATHVHTGKKSRYDPIRR